MPDRKSKGQFKMPISDGVGHPFRPPYTPLSFLLTPDAQIRYKRKSQDAKGDGGSLLEKMGLCRFGLYKSPFTS